jgi:hypothetical protein
MNLTRWLSLAAAVAVLSACGTTASPFTPGSGPAILNSPLASRSEKSWILAEAKHEDLLYVSDNGANDVLMLSYPDLKLVGKLQGFGSPRGLCADKAGDVFITNFQGQDILEYAHGSKLPKANLTEHGHSPYDCAVDPTTGNLAVANYCDGIASSSGCDFDKRPDDLVVFPKGKGSPRDYSLASFANYEFCAYDQAGNLLVDGLGAEGYSPVQFAELPAGGKSLKQITLNKTMDEPGAIQWDGSHFAVENDPYRGIVIYQFQINKGLGKAVGSTPLEGTQLVQEFLIDGSKLVAPGEKTVRYNETYPIYFWNYPAGGEPIESVKNANQSQPFGVTLSRAN